MKYSEWYLNIVQRAVKSKKVVDLSRKDGKKLRKSELSPKLEKALDDIATGKEKLVKYENFDEYIKHVKQVLEE